MTQRTIRIATRQSPLALAQVHWVAARIKEHAPDVVIEEVHVLTKGDKVTDKPLASIGGKGLFINEVEAQLVAGAADMAVHSMKDVPTDDDLAEGMDLICVPEREDPHDVLVTRDGIELSELKEGATIGTSSLRRSCQLGVARPDLRFAVCRGNVGTRLRKLDEGQYDAIVLAAAGLRRLQIDRSYWTIPPDTSLPATGQGALGIEARVDATELLDLLKPLEHRPTRLAIEAERAYLKRLHGSCTTPVAAHARFDDDGETRMRIDGIVGSIDGKQLLRSSTDGYVNSPDYAARLSTAARMGIELAEMLLERGAAELIAEARNTPDPYVLGPYGPH